MISDVLVKLKRFKEKSISIIKNKIFPILKPFIEFICNKVIPVIYFSLICIPAYIYKLELWLISFFPKIIALFSILNQDEKIINSYFGDVSYRQVFSFKDPITGSISFNDEYCWYHDNTTPKAIYIKRFLRWSSITAEILCFVLLIVFVTLALDTVKYTTLPNIQANKYHIMFTFKILLDLYIISWKIDRYHVGKYKGLTYSVINYNDENILLDSIFIVILILNLS